MKNVDFSVWGRKALRGLKRLGEGVLRFFFWMLVQYAVILGFGLLAGLCPRNERMMFLGLCGFDGFVISAALISILGCSVFIMTIVGTVLLMRRRFGKPRFNRAFWRWALFYAVVIVAGMLIGQTGYDCRKERWFWICMLNFLALPWLWLGEMKLLYGLQRRCRYRRIRRKRAQRVEKVECRL